MDRKSVVLDIAVNLNRIGNWAADDFNKKRKRILFFLAQTTEFINSLTKESFSAPFKKTFDTFFREYLELEKEAKIGPKDCLFWAEKMMTWGNILTHRAQLLDE